MDYDSDPDLDTDSYMDADLDQDFYREQHPNLFNHHDGHADLVADSYLDADMDSDSHSDLDANGFCDLDRHSDAHHDSVDKDFYVFIHAHNVINLDPNFNNHTESNAQCDIYADL